MPCRIDQCLIFCRTNFDCDNLEAYLNTVGGGGRYRGKMEKGKENPYSCLVLAGQRSMQERRAALQVNLLLATATLEFQGIIQRLKSLISP